MNSRALACNDRSTPNVFLEYYNTPQIQAFGRRAFGRRAFGVRRAFGRRGYVTMRENISVESNRRCMLQHTGLRGVVCLEDITIEEDFTEDTEEERTSAVDCT